MRLHKEGFITIIICTAAVLLINFILFYFFGNTWSSWLILIVTLVILVFIFSFFRVPTRSFTPGEDSIIAPADGTVVTIEEVEADEFFKDKRLQVSIFMSPLNVHVNRNPVSGEVIYSKYHKGKYLVAWHPKSSTENERHTVVYDCNGKQLLVKQIAGALAKRIVNYLKPNDEVKQGSEMGFIKFGSRVDLLMPLDTQVLVKLNQKVKGGLTILGKW
jgi:phosphatidylserine decarboxylase